jgi:hypothetical protein
MIFLLEYDDFMGQTLSDLAIGIFESRLIALGIIWFLLHSDGHHSGSTLARSLGREEDLTSLGACFGRTGYYSTVDGCFFFS